MAGDDERREAYAAARDTTKQLITLATSILTVTITFRRDAAPATDAGVNAILMAAWVGFAASAGFGVLGLAILTAEQGRTGGRSAASPWLVRWPLVVQMVVFMAATALIVWFGIREASAIVP
jgi:hypothetical protein